MSKKNLYRIMSFIICFIILIFIYYTNYYFNLKKTTLQKIPVSVELIDTDKPPIYTGAGETKQNEIWVVFQDGTKKLVVSSSKNKDSIKQIAEISNPKLTTDGKIYFETLAYATENNIFVVDIKTKHIDFVCFGYIRKLIESGEYQNHIIVNFREYGHEYIEHIDYIIDQKANKLKKISEEEYQKLI